MIATQSLTTRKRILRIIVPDQCLSTPSSRLLPDHATGATGAKKGGAEAPPHGFSRLALPNGPSIAGFVDQLVLGDPGHHAAERLADGLDRVGVVHAARRLELGLAGAAFPHPFGGEGAGLD